MTANKLFTIITPSTGRRPRALAACIASIAVAIDRARCMGLSADQVEMLVGYDGVKGPRYEDCPPFVKFFDLPEDNDWGNGIRNILLRAAKGERILFIDDDNSLTPTAFITWMEHPEADMMVARADTQLAFDEPFLPRREPGAAPGKVVRQGNIDPLCVCVRRKVVNVLCGGWGHPGLYEADFLNLRAYQRRSRNFVQVDDVVGVYDSGRSLDNKAHSRRQMHMLDRLAAERGLSRQTIPNVEALLQTA